MRVFRRHLLISKELTSPRSFTSNVRFDAVKIHIVVNCVDFRLNRDLKIMFFLFDCRRSEPKGCEKKKKKFHDYLN